MKGRSYKYKITGTIVVHARDEIEAQEMVDDNLLYMDGLDTDEVKLVDTYEDDGSN